MGNSFGIKKKIKGFGVAGKGIRELLPAWRGAPEGR
jgi:hypothetical protein